jgi:hypothetical protein
MRLQRQIFAGMQLCVVFLASAPATADHVVVLVTRSDSPIETVDPLDVRKLYLGFSVRTEENLSVRAATNQSENKLFEIFLQDVMAMSARSYDRRLLTLTLQSGRRRPDIYRNVGELTDALGSDPNLISFMWQEDFEKADNLKVLRVIWKE